MGISNFDQLFLIIKFYVYTNGCCVRAWLYNYCT